MSTITTSAKENDALLLDIDDDNNNNVDNNNDTDKTCTEVVINDKKLNELENEERIKSSRR